MTREPQYAACFEEERVELGPMTGATWRWNPRRLGFLLARYKFVAQMLRGSELVAEIGCADAFATAVVQDAVGAVDLFDFDPVFAVKTVRQHDIVSAVLPRRYDAIYMLDVLEHIAPEDEHSALANIVVSLTSTGVFIAGVPSLESQVYASPISRAGHVNCKTGDDLLATGRRYFKNVFLFSMNDEVVHTGFSKMAHYLFIVCCGPKS